MRHRGALAAARLTRMVRGVELREGPGGLRLHDEAGVWCADMRLWDDDGVPAAGPVVLRPGASPTAVAVMCIRLLAGRRLDTPDDRLADALVAQGVTLTRAATDLRHDLTDLLPPSLPNGWQLVAGGWDASLEESLTAAYADGHPDGTWTPKASAEVSGMFAPDAEVPALAGASARVRGPDVRSYGHVLVAGPVPWRPTRCGWVLNLAVAPAAQGRGLGRALLAHALRGTHAAGLPALELSVVDGGPGRRLYNAAGFEVLAGVLSIPLPGTAAA